MAILGTILSGSQTFVAGMQMSFIVMTIILFGGSVLSFAFIGKKQ
ncbi:hypothetical protein [Paenibacillus xylanivorans]|nr:hypothetical protein [Paenibacillus xylanivorans]